MNSVVIRDQETIKLQNKLSLDKSLNSAKGSRRGNSGNKLELCVLTQLHHVPWLVARRKGEKVNLCQTDHHAHTWSTILKSNSCPIDEVLHYYSKKKTRWFKERKPACSQQARVEPELATLSQGKLGLRLCKEWTRVPVASLAATLLLLLLLLSLHLPTTPLQTRTMEVGDPRFKTSKISHQCIGVEKVKKLERKWNDLENCIDLT